MRRDLFTLVALGAAAASGALGLACGSASSADAEVFDASDVDAGIDGASSDAGADAPAGGEKSLTVKCAHAPCATRLRAGASFACAILQDGSVRCWGDDADGQLGQADGGLPSGKALRVGAWSDAVDLSAYGSIMGPELHEGACVRHASGDVTCWGDDSGGQLELGTVSAAERVAAGPTTSCAIRTSGELVCFGPLSPGDFAGRHGARSVATSLHAALLVTGDGRLWSWGTASAPPRFISPLGRSVSTPSAEPAVLDGLPAVSNVVAGAQHACALAEGRVFCWGYNEDGQLGTGSHVTSERPLEVPLPSDARPTSLALSERTTCVTTSDGRAFCWGANEVGQLGSGDYAAHFRPTPVRALEAAIVEMAPMNFASCALLESGKIVCWGFNGTGSLGTGSVDFDEHLDPATVQLDDR